MAFNSFSFLLFFPTLVVVYYGIAHRYRWLLLLVASYFFYSEQNPAYLFVLLFVTLVNYFAGLQIANAADTRNRRTCLIASIVISLGTLISFKYFGFFKELVALGLHVFNSPYQVPSYQLLLPLGISFYTFQTMSYTIDVYRGHIQAERHLGIFGLYVAFFPQLIAGPIERSSHLLPQFRREVHFDYVQVTEGLKRITWGFFKKLVIADRLAYVVDTVYAHPQSFESFPLIVATYCFAFQLYCDFSGYIDIAIGVAQILGFRLSENFKAPFFSRNPVEIWRRWHITLSDWFRSYLFLPLMRRNYGKGKWPQYANLMLIYILIGLWHGATWTYLAWGALNGLLQLIFLWIQNRRSEFQSKPLLVRFPMLLRIMQTALTFHLIIFLGIFFRANSIGDAFYIIQHLFTNLTPRLVGLTRYEWKIAAAAILALFIVDIIQERENVWSVLGRQPVWVRWGIYYALVMSIVLLGEFNYKDFVYFAF